MEHVLEYSTASKINESGLCVLSQINFKYIVDLDSLHGRFPGTLELTCPESSQLRTGPECPHFLLFLSFLLPFLYLLTPVLSLASSNLGLCSSCLSCFSSSFSFFSLKGEAGGGV